MDPELQALREARLAQLKTGNNGKTPTNGGKADRASSPSQSNSPPPIGAAIAPFLESEALERLSRVNMVRPERAHNVEAYLTKLISSGHVTRKITEDEIVDILNGVARQENRSNETKIIFNRRDEDWEGDLAAEEARTQESDEDDFFE